MTSNRSRAYIIESEERGLRIFGSQLPPEVAANLSITLRIGINFHSNG